MSTATMSSKPAPKVSPFTSSRSYLQKKCAAELKSFDTSFIKYRSDSMSSQATPTMKGAGGNNNDTTCYYSHHQQHRGGGGDDGDSEMMNVSYIMSPSIHMNTSNNNNKMSGNYNHTNGGGGGGCGGGRHLPGDKMLSPPHSDDYCYDPRCCSTLVEYTHGGKLKNYAMNTLIRSKFSNSSPSVFYSTTTNGNNNNNIIGHYKSRCYSGSKIKDKKVKASLNLSVEIDRRVYGLMERFMARSPMFYIPKDPSDLTNCNPFNELNQCIWDVYAKNAQKEGTYIKKLEFWRRIYLSIQKIIVRYGLFLVGSTMSGLGLDSSDIDMCLLVRPGVADPRTDALAHLQNVCNLLKQKEFVRAPEVIMAKVPILKFRDATHGFEVDLNCNNSVGIRNTHLLNAYAQLDWRVRPMVVIVKLWAQANDINDAKRMTINSYSLALMTLHYLQYGVNPPAIPCLQAMYPDRFGPQVEIQSLDLQGELPEYYSDNKQSLGELFLGFLHYFSNFNYNQFAMSVREGGLIGKEECRYVRAPKNDIGQWKLLCIEEPFDLTNTARCVYDVATFEYIKNVFRVSYETLVRTKQLDAILPCAVAPNVHHLFGMPVGMSPSPNQR